MTNFQASSAIVNELERKGSSAKDKLLSEGWLEHSMWTEVSHAGQKSREEARVLCRHFFLIEKCPEYFARKTHNSNLKALEAVSNLSVDNISVNRPHETLNIHSLQDLTSVQNMRSNKESLTLALDTEFVNLEKERYIVSYQFACYDRKDFNKIHEVVFLPISNHRLSFWRMMSWILTEFNLCKSHDFNSAMRWLATVKSGGKILRKPFKSPEEAYEATILEKERDLFQDQFSEYGEPFRSKNNGIDGGYIFDFSDFVKNDITLVCHWGQADLSTFEIPNSETDELEIIANCTKIQGGLVTLKPIHKLLKEVQNSAKYYNISLNIRDTMCFAPARQKSLKNLGDSIYVKKLELPYNAIEHMDRYFSNDPVHYMDYATNDSLIGLMYSSELWGVNKAMPVTTTSGAVKAAKTILKKHFDASNDNELNVRYRGIQLKNIGKEKNYSHNGRRFKNKKCLEPISDDAFILMNMASNAYNGGFNGCLGARYVDKLTHDFDLLQAYPTALVCIPDPEWDSNNLISRTIEKRLLTIDDFNSPFDLVFGDIEFAFQKDVLFPCIPINVDGSLIFPRTSEGLTKCYASTPEIYIALKLGAEIKARRVYIASQRIMPDGSPSRCFYKVAKQLVYDRQLAKEIWGSKSLEQSLLKISINSIYGKIAQNIKPKSSWNAASAMMEDIGCSSITSPVHACLITAGVRAVLNATINQLSALGRKCYSVTTDGFISDATLDESRSLDLYGFREIFEEARKRLTGSPEMWEVKHSQSSFLNFSTRGNISQDENGVCAHNGFHASYKYANYGEVEIKPNGLIDRYSTTLNIALRNGRICSSEKHFTRASGNCRITAITQAKSEI